MSDENSIGWGSTTYFFPKELCEAIYTGLKRYESLMDLCVAENNYDRLASVQSHFIGTVAQEVVHIYFEANGRDKCPFNLVNRIELIWWAMKNRNFDRKNIPLERDILHWALEFVAEMDWSISNEMRPK